jgi:hypothetical protein
MTSDPWESVMRIIQEQNRREDEEEFQQFCEKMLSVPANLKLVPKDNFTVDIELQPLRWLSLGIDLLRSRRVTRHIRLPNGVQEPEIGSYLPYPVFQAATEIFLKGIWLCQYAECRALTDSSYINPAKRQYYAQILKNLSHDLLVILDSLRRVPEYRRTPETTRFFDLVERVVRLFYFPPYEADRRTPWADARYPKRVYDDSARKAAAESFRSYPPAKWVEKLFAQAERDLDELFRIRAELGS